MITRSQRIILPAFIFAITILLLPGFTQAGSDVIWTYDSPPGFSFIEPSYRFPTQIKQALIDNVKGSRKLESEYDSVFRDREQFGAWLLDILQRRLDYFLKSRELSLSTAANMQKTVDKAIATAGYSKRIDHLTDEMIDETAGYRQRAIDEQQHADSIQQQIRILQAWMEDMNHQKSVTPKKKKS